MSQDDEAQAINARPLNVVGLIFLGLAMFICINSFANIGSKVQHALVLNGYVIPMSPGTEKTFGFGDESGLTQDQVPLQGREMSNRAFKITNQPEVGIVVTGLDDQIRYRRKWYQGPNNSFVIANGERFRSRGPLGSATFEVNFDRQANQLHLTLLNPIYREFDAQRATRLFFGMRHTPLPAPVDEIFFRVPPTVGTGSSYLLSIEEDRLKLKPDIDLAREPVRFTQPVSVTDAPSTPQTKSEEMQAITLVPGEAQTLNNLELTFTNVSPSAVQWYGVKLLLATIFIGLAFFIGPQVRIPNGLLLFGAVSFLLSLGIVLSARDYFFAPHEGRFERYLQVIFWSTMLLYGLRYPHATEPAASDQGDGVMDSSIGLRTILSGLCFILAYCSLNGDWGEVSWSFLRSFWPGWLNLLVVLIGWMIILLVTNWLYKAVWYLLELVTNPPLPLMVYWILLLLSLVPLIAYIAAKAQGYSIMLWVPLIGRIYLPALFLPVVVSGTVLLIFAWETEEPTARVLRIISLCLLWGTIVLYRLVEGDNGGTLIMGIGLLAAAWASVKNRMIPLLLTLVLLTGGVVALFLTPERFDLAWNADEAQVLYFDQAKNLRTGRDLARAGGWTGQWLDLRVPSDVRGNIHNDLVSAFVAGFFGWLILIAVLCAFLFIFLTLWGTLSGMTQTEASGFRADADTVPSPEARSRLILTAIAASIIVVLGVQYLWAFTQPLQPLLPLVGFDLQPISTSGSSVLSFMIVLLGSVFIAQTASKGLVRA